TFIPFTLSMGIKLAGVNITPYADDAFTKVKFKAPADPADAQIWVQIWEGENLLSEVEVNDFTYGEWKTITFDNFIPVDIEKEYFVGYKIISGNGIMAWHDAGPRVEGGAYTRNTGWMSLKDDHDYNFCIKAITISQTQSAAEETIVALSSLGNNYPNPFNPTTTISFNLAEGGNVELGIYNVKGQKVSTIVNEHKSAGSHSIVWNGTDDRGTGLTSGVYFYRIKSGKFTSTKKMILLK
ncbi:MAG: T9SS type A sorting domain-containing protein, partial [Candidatus Cloacimonetes bacterium]|nr:T9SS type A sorting domain-containing protein [Candidatus Cloacimonadota bacterium]